MPAARCATIPKHTTYDTLLDILEYLRHFPGRYHHPREDVAFACLAKRDAALAPLLERLHEEHRQLAVAGEKLQGLLVAAAEDTVASRQEIESAAQDYLAAYREHIAEEELNVMPHAGALLTDADWAEVARAIPMTLDPLFGAGADEAYKELRRKIALESA